MQTSKVVFTLERFPVPSMAQRCWRPLADVYRTATGWLVKLELAGVRPQDLLVEQKDRWLTVTGTRRDIPIEGCSCQSLEISYDSFERRFEFPADLSQLPIRTEFQNGMLLIRIG
jgi:HSP20 family protein